MATSNNKHPRRMPPYPVSRVSWYRPAPASPLNPPRSPDYSAKRLPPPDWWTEDDCVPDEFSTLALMFAESLSAPLLIPLVRRHLEPSPANPLILPPLTSEPPTNVPAATATIKLEPALAPPVAPLVAPTKSQALLAPSAVSSPKLSVASQLPGPSECKTATKSQERGTQPSKRKTFPQASSKHVSKAKTKRASSHASCRTPKNKAIPHYCKRNYQVLQCRPQMLVSFPVEKISQPPRQEHKSTIFYCKPVDGHSSHTGVKHSTKSSLGKRQHEEMTSTSSKVSHKVRKLTVSIPLITPRSAAELASGESSQTLQLQSTPPSKGEPSQPSQVLTPEGNPSGSIAKQFPANNCSMCVPGPSRCSSVEVKSLQRARMSPKTPQIAHSSIPVKSSLRQNGPSAAILLATAYETESQANLVTSPMFTSSYQSTTTKISASTQTFAQPLNTCTARVMIANARAAARARKSKGGVSD